MTKNQKKKCHTIIHSHAVAAAAGNAVPVPGLGQVVAPSIAVVMIKAAGWVLANELEAKLKRPDSETR